MRRLIRSAGMLAASVLLASVVATTPTAVAAVEGHGAAQTVRIMLLGDSITHGHDIPGSYA